MRKQEAAQQAEWLFPSVPSPMATVSLSLSPAPAEPSTALGLSLLADTAELGSGAPALQGNLPPPQEFAGSHTSASCAHLKQAPRSRSPWGTRLTNPKSVLG